MIIPQQGSHHLSMLILLVSSILDSFAPNLLLKVLYWIFSLTFNMADNNDVNSEPKQDLSPDVFSFDRPWSVCAQRSVKFAVNYLKSARHPFVLLLLPLAKWCSHQSLPFRFWSMARSEEVDKYVLHIPTISKIVQQRSSCVWGVRYRVALNENFSIWKKTQESSSIHLIAHVLVHWYCSTLSLVERS